MKAIADSTVLFHLDNSQNKMKEIIKSNGITDLCITRFNYLETLSGASENAKIEVRKILNVYKVLEFDNKAYEVANKLAFKYRVGSKQKIDFLIASIAIANKLPLLTENNKDFSYKELKLLPYNISSWF